MIYMFSLMMMLMVMMMVLMVVLDNKEMNKTATFIWKCKHLNILKMLDENCTANNYFKDDISQKLCRDQLFQGWYTTMGCFIMLKFFLTEQIVPTSNICGRCSVFQLQSFTRAKNSEFFGDVYFCVFSILKNLYSVYSVQSNEVCRCPSNICI